jgi:hypothetical protein
VGARVGRRNQVAVDIVSVRGVEPTAVGRRVLLLRDESFNGVLIVGLHRIGGARGVLVGRTADPGEVDEVSLRTQSS